jgi:alkanesulfonate monooxygenase SsuD/methylene tetrahydromethanopterin reductase-like flavin-dependent oxidoreductase (luciferase family)
MPEDSSASNKKMLQRRNIVKISIGLPSTLSHVTGSLLLDWAREADADPFLSLAVIDRLVYHNYDAFTALAAAAGATRRIRLMTSILLAPLYPTALLAKQLASLDALSNGRLTAGLSVGMREDDFTAVSSPFHHRGKYFDSQLETMQRIWAGQALNDDVMAIGPKPMQPEGPDLLLGGISPAALRRLGRWGNGYIAGMMPIDEVNRFYRM